ncbi:MAG: hypothetical protein H0W78_08765 [Planctomycetes bacterium]|jgi:hypothetical protein|nr:hypothetical protein [Planctomycetota bacterium]
MTTPNMQTVLGLSGADAAILRAAQQARRIAAQSGTPLAVWQDGRVVQISATTEVSTPAPQQNPSGA